MEKYSSKTNARYFNMSIDGLDIVAEEITPTESFNRRETIRKNIIGGTQHVIRGAYVPRNFNVITHFMIDPDYPDIYDETFQEWQSKPVEVISRELGGKFDAEIIIKRHHNDSPNFLKLEINIVEIPTSTSNIPNDAMKVNTDELKDKITVTGTSSSNSNASTSISNKSSISNLTKGTNVTSTLKSSSKLTGLLEQAKDLFNG